MTNLTSIHGKNPQQTRKRGELHLHDKEHLQITTANVFNGEKWVGFPLRSGTRQRCLTLTILLHQHTGSPSYCNKTRKGNKMYTDEKGMKLFVHTWYDYL